MYVQSELLFLIEYGAGKAMILREFFGRTTLPQYKELDIPKILSS